MISDGLCLDGHLHVALCTRATEPVLLVCQVSDRGPSTYIPFLAFHGHLVES